MIKLRSDFSDYYDYLSSDNKSILYNRFRRDSMNRGTALNFLKNNGIKTVEFGPIRKFGFNQKLVVYTEPSLHECQGKHIYTFDEAIFQYSNCVMSEFLETTNGYTVKYLQIGERRFRLMFHNPNFMQELSEGKLINFEELPKQYNYGIGLPIYSIDYISNGTEMVAVDFNEVQQLNTIGIDNIIPAEDVAMEIKKALIAYNKV